MATTWSSARAADARSLHEALERLVAVSQFWGRQIARRYDLSVTQCRALATLADRGPLCVNELAAQLFLEKSTASRVAAGLEAKGLVARAQDATDGRIVRLDPTPVGRLALERVRDDLEDRYAWLLADFDPEVRGAMTRLMGKLAASFRLEANRTDHHPQMSKKST